MTNRRDEMAMRLREARKKAGYSSVSDAANAFGWTPSTVTSHENGTREFDVEAAIRYAKALKTSPGWLLALDQVQPNTPSFNGHDLGRAEIPFLGKVAAGIWMEQSFVDPDEQTTVPVDQMPGHPIGELFAVTPEGESMNLTIPPKATLICRRIPFSGFAALIGDLVIVERSNHDLREMTCKRLGFENGEYVLKSESDRPEFATPISIGKPSEDNYADNDITVIGVVLRAVLDFQRGAM